jgi:hypothetical protein
MSFFSVTGGIDKNPTQQQQQQQLRNSLRMHPGRNIDIIIKAKEREGGQCVGC